MTIILHKINLTQFRSYETLRLDTHGARTVVLTGPNGAGKTNILEAISLLVPGKGLRGVSLPELKNRHADADDVWAVAADLETAKGERTRIGTGMTRDGRRRAVRIDGKDSKNVSELADYLSAVWLTPQMDRIFLEGSAARRRFLDRLVYAYQPDHAAHLSRYEKHMRERLRLLTADHQRPDPVWLDALEMQMAADAVSIAAARVHLADRLMAQVERERTRDNLFPQPLITVEGRTEAALHATPAVDIEDGLRATYKSSRQADAAAGKTLHGVHRSDMNVSYADKTMPADQCSTGEQKGMLLSILLAHAELMQAEKGHVPLLLLDEVAAHLDDSRRGLLFDRLRLLDAQLWLTGTNADDFRSFRDDACHFSVDHGHVSAVDGDDAA